MKLSILIILTLFFSSCGAQKKKVPDINGLGDTALISAGHSLTTGTLLDIRSIACYACAADSFEIYKAQCDSLKKTIDSLSKKMFVSNYKLERVRYYLNITLRKPSQTKFLKGWIKRAIE
jgi:hypothetical protein